MYAVTSRSDKAHLNCAFCQTQLSILSLTQNGAPSRFFDIRGIKLQRADGDWAKQHRELGPFFKSGNLHRLLVMFHFWKQTKKVYRFSLVADSAGVEVERSCKLGKSGWFACETYRIVGGMDQN